MKKMLLLCLSYAVLSNVQAQSSLNMNLLGQWDDPTLPSAGSITYNDIWGYSDCEGHEYAILGSAKYVHFFDITDAENPMEINRFEGSVNSIWRDMKTYQHYAYAVADQGSDGLMVFDLSNLPESVSMVNQLNGDFFTSHNIYIDEGPGRIYVVGAGSNTLVYDLSQDPANPVLMRNGGLPGGYVHDIFVRDNIGYCSHGGNGLWVYDFSDPSNIITLGSLTSYPQQGYNHSSWLHENSDLLVFADETHGLSLKLVDVSDPQQITLLDLFKSALQAPTSTSSIAHNPFIRGNYVVISYYHDGVQVFDLSNPADVQQVAWYDTYPENTTYPGYEGCWGVYPFLPSGKIIASDISHGLFVLEMEGLSFPETPALAANLSQPDPTMVCPGDSTLLVLEDTPYPIQWYFNNEPIDFHGTSLWAKEAGSYTASVSRGPCEVISEPIEVAFLEAPVVSTEDIALEVCDVESLKLTAPGGGFLYRWYLNGQLVNESSSPFLGISESGIYQYEIVSSNGCSALSGDIDVLIHPPIIPSLSVLQPANYCEGQSEIVVQVDNNYDYYMIQDGGIAQFFENSYAITSSGSYEVLVSDGVCEVTLNLPFDVAFYPPIVPTIAQNENLLTASEAISYQWLKDGITINGATAQNLLVEESGAYAVQTIDANGCEAVSEELSIVINSHHSLSFSPYRLFPNPASDRFILVETKEVLLLNLIAANGQVVQRYPNTFASDQMECPVGDLPSGMYWLEVLEKNGNKARLKLLKL
ncbi:MAG TPA: choice-of-anchor B family protein [Saprospiraceae bacterium]|nr:choice-of-anchor B family protein [Saprospiraceae bacterium]HMQ81293.1 choice-of-anchor B family protein [Saprospiraceae bacterium]